MVAGSSFKEFVRPIVLVGITLVAVTTPLHPGSSKQANEDCQDSFEGDGQWHDEEDCIASVGKVAGIQLGISQEFAGSAKPALSQYHTFFEFGYMEHGFVMGSLSFATLTVYHERDILPASGLRFTAGYIFESGLILAAGAGFYTRSQISETLRIGYLDNSGFNISFFMSGFRYADQVDTLHFGFGVGFVFL